MEGGEGGVLGIRREESSVWERRAPLSPNHVQSLVSKGVKVCCRLALIVYSSYIQSTGDVQVNYVTAEA